ncbi:hypothetical protein [Candidiatus Paracoxiella cheracis]|uniref:hypothetical protein n=1 Tax=Candidiatus Paracoxiella cheracis TaxID=3405120 RepID=UPI003BF47E91
MFNSKFNMSELSQQVLLLYEAAKTVKEVIYYLQEMSDTSSHEVLMKELVNQRNLLNLIASGINFCESEFKTSVSVSSQERAAQSQLFRQAQAPGKEELSRGSQLHASCVGGMGPRS